MTPEDARLRFAAGRVAHLATATAGGQPHLVPLVFAVDGDRVLSVVDAKPKRSTALRRMANVMENPLVSLLVDHYDDDWSALWWVRADGTGRIHETGSAAAEASIDLLAARYEQYKRRRPQGSVLEVDVLRWSGWSASS
ncbi:MAG: TIGR03668 family PPOX class F420-dependent oxidoreductase [Acidimicrobiales bacterium]